MKKAFNSIFTLAIALFVSINFSYYSTIGRVVGFDRDSDTIYIETTDGNIWEYEEIQDWMIDDLCSMVFCDNGTSEVYDDEVVYMRYIGYIVCRHNF